MMTSYYSNKGLPPCLADEPAHYFCLVGAFGLVFHLCGFNCAYELVAQRRLDLETQRNQFFSVFYFHGAPLSFCKCIVRTKVRISQ